MKRIIILLILALAVTSCAGNRQRKANEEKEMVWICTGSSATTYHDNRSCRGLNNCRATIEEIPLEEAEVYRRPCKICYNY